MPTEYSSLQDILKVTKKSQLDLRYGICLANKKLVQLLHH